MVCLFIFLSILVTVFLLNFEKFSVLYTKLYFDVPYMKIRGKSVFKYQIHIPTTVQMLLKEVRLRVLELARNDPKLLKKVFSDFDLN